MGIGVTASVLAQPSASTVQQHTTKLWALWHCWARIEQAATRGNRLTAGSLTQTVLYSLMDEEQVGGDAVNRCIEQQL